MHLEGVRGVSQVSKCRPLQQTGDVFKRTFWVNRQPVVGCLNPVHSNVDCSRWPSALELILRRQLYNLRLEFLADQG